jgi:purine/pyrimidine-nucleoside phosphorylase
MKHSSYFDGKVQSLELMTADGRATVGVIDPGSYSFPTSTRERIVLVEGSMKVRLPGSGWQTLLKGEEVVVRAGVSFDIEATEQVAYVCYYG